MLGCVITRAMARHRLRRLPFIGVRVEAVQQVSRDARHQRARGAAGAAPAAHLIDARDFYVHQAWGGRAAGDAVGM